MSRADFASYQIVHKYAYQKMIQYKSITDLSVIDLYYDAKQRGL